MKYYKNDNTGELMASLDELLDLQDPNKPGHIKSMTRVIFPNRKIGNGIQYHILSHSNISYNFKRIARPKFMELCPDFGQFRHHNDDSCNRYNLEVNKRKETFGLVFKK